AKMDLTTAVNPCRGVERNPTNDRERILSDDEIQRLWAVLDRIDTPQARACQMILVTGQRPGEVSCMRFEQVVDGGWWKIPGAIDPKIGWPGTKNKRDHKVWLPEAARAVSNHRGNVTSISGFVFADAGNRPVERLDELMRAVCEKLGIRDKVTPHDLRRSFLSTVTKLRFSRHLMDLIANHKTKTTTDVY